MVTRKNVAEFDAVTNPFERKMAGMDRAVANWEKGTLGAFGRVEKGVNGILASVSRLGLLAGIGAGGFGVALGAQFLDTTTQIRNGLRGIGQDSDENFQKVYLAATRSMGGLESFLQTAVRIHKVLGDTQSFDQTIRQVETLNKLMALGGRSTAERQSTLLQFAQALQSGVLQGDELRSLRENAPVELLRAIAQEAGGTLQSLKALGEQGAITSDVMIRALDRLAAVADAKIKDVVPTIADGAVALRNAALVAAEGFNEGSGLGRATASSLKNLGELLASNAEAFEMFGKAAKAALPFIAAAIAGRGASAGLATLKAYNAALKETAASTQMVTDRAAAQVAKNQALVASGNARVQNLILQGATTAQLERAELSLGKAQTALTLSEERLAVASNAAALAQTRLAFSARAAGAAVSLVRGAFAFIGGIPGLILIAGTALLTMAANARTFADVMADSDAALGRSQGAVSALADVQDRLNLLLEDAGGASDAAHRKIMLNTAAELFAKRQLLEIENKQLEATRKVTELTRDGIKAQIASEEAWIAASKADIQRLRDLKFAEDGPDISGDQADIRKSEAAIVGLKDQLSGVNSELILTGLQLDANNGYLDGAAQILARIAADRAMGQLADGARDAQGFLQGVADKLDSISGVSLPDPFGAMIDGAKRLLAWLNGLITGFASLPGGGSLNHYPPNAGGARAEAGSSDTPVLPGSMTPGHVKPEKAPRDLEGNIIVDAAGSGSGSDGGGGGGESQVEKDRKAALDFIESMMTAQERQAAQLQDILALRERMVKQYGPEAAQVKQLDEAISRAQDSMASLNTGMTDFFGTLGDQLASSIRQWEGWGNFIRSLLASLVQKWGPDFFEALFMPGRQTGGGFGTVLGNLLTGNLASAAAPGLNMAAAGLNMPARKMAGGTNVHQTNYNDFRGADPGSEARIMQKLAENEKKFSGKVISVLGDVRRGRVKI